MLSENEILSLKISGALEVHPFLGTQLRGPSYVLRLGKRFKRWKKVKTNIRLWSSNAADKALFEPFESSTVVLEPNEFMLACTLELLRLPKDHVGIITPLSHVARFGLGVTGGSDFVNPGHGGKAPASLTLELMNNNQNSLELDAGMPIARIRFEHLSDSETCPPPAPSIYDGADPVCSPSLFEEWNSKIDTGQL